MESLDENMLRQFGGVSNNNLLDNISFDANEQEELLGNQMSSYVMEDDVLNVIDPDIHTFSVLTLNCQSLNAKFDSLLLYINDMNRKGFMFDVICLQET